MGGGDKALRALGDRLVIAHVIEALETQVQDLVINANGDAARFVAFGRPVVADEWPGFAGPLAGLHAGMAWARAQRPGSRWIATAPCDTPFLPRDLVARLAAAAEASGADIAVASSGGREHYACGLWSLALEDDLARHVASGGRKVRDWIARHSHVTVPFAPIAVPVGALGGRSLDPFFNINTPEELAEAEALLGQGAPIPMSPIMSASMSPVGSASVPPVFGVVGWKNSGKTTLVSRLIAELTARGLKVAAVKHAHHAFDVDQPGRDSYKFREAGAREVAVVSGKRVAVMHELRDEAEPALEDVLRRLEGSDIVLVEGFKRHDHPKIEARRLDSAQRDAMGADMPGIVAIASDHPVEAAGMPVFALDDVAGIAAFILRHTGAGQAA